MFLVVYYIITVVIVSNSRIVLLLNPVPRPVMYMAIVSPHMTSGKALHATEALAPGSL